MPRRVVRFVDKPIGDYEDYTNSKYKGSVVHKYLTKVKLTPNKYNHDIIFKCICDSHILLSYSAYYSLEKDGTIEGYNCGCVEQGLINKVKDNYHNRNLTQCSINNVKCKSCMGFYPKVGVKGSCNNCEEVQRLKVKLYDTFEDLMNKWNPNCHDGRYRRLPYLSGTSLKGYKVKGFTYIDAQWYEEASKVMWTRVNKYISFSLSKDNMKRLGKKVRPIRVAQKQVRLHRYVLGLGDNTCWVGDHARGFTLDNRFKNLRVADNKTNALNTRKSGGRSKFTKYKGVSYYENRNKKWRMSLKRGEYWEFKSFYTDEDAARYYDLILRDKFPSEFNRYNFPLEGELGVDI